MGHEIAEAIIEDGQLKYISKKLPKGRIKVHVIYDVAEGVKTTESAYRLAQKLDVDMPITTEVYNIIFKGKDPKIALYDLMTRSPKPEIWL